MQGGWICSRGHVGVVVNAFTAGDQQQENPHGESASVHLGKSLSGFLRLKLGADLTETLESGR